MILEMVHIQIICLRNQIEDVVNRLQQLGAVQIDDIHDQPEAEIRPFTIDSATLSKQEELRYLAAQLQGLLDLLKIEHIPAPPQSHTTQISIQTIKNALNERIPRVQSLVEQKHALQVELETLPRYISTLRKLIPIVPESADHHHNITIGILVNRNHLAALDILQMKIAEITKGTAEFISGSMDEVTQAMLIVCPRQYADELESILGREDISRMRLPSGMNYLSPRDALVRLLNRQELIPAEIKQVQTQIGRLAQSWYEECRTWLAHIKDELSRYDILSCFGETHSTVIIYGWVPEKHYAALNEALKSDGKQTIVLQRLPIAQAQRDCIPVAVENTPPVQPFESLVNLLARPRYGGWDPSGLMFLFMPLFFGMILGDIGYGALILLIALPLRKRFSKGIARDLIMVLIYGAAWTIVFGILYGELFGNIGEHIGLHPIWFDRASSENIISLLLISAGLGAGHVVLGLILGIWNAAAERSRSHLLERGGMLVGLCGLFLLTGVLSNMLPETLMTPSVAAIILGMTLLGIPAGKPGFLVGPLEMLGVVGNILSYMRIAAIGLASVYLARVANDIAGQTGSIFLGLILAILIHALNLVMGVFSPTIHSLRLHYVEFFRKFYEGGGRPYEPFKSQLLSSP